LKASVALGLAMPAHWLPEFSGLPEVTSTPIAS
jgi:hypothetical protein